MADGATDILPTHPTVSDLADAEFSAVAQEWEALAQEKPFWSALTDSYFLNPTDDAITAFLSSGETDVSLATERARQHAEYNTSRALDLGCGPGRLSKALSSRFNWIIGVDSSPTMISIAQRLNTEPNITFERMRGPRLHYESRSFDFVLSLLVLQHQPLPLAIVLLEECCRLIASPGVAAIQIPVSFRSDQYMIVPNSSCDPRIKVFPTPPELIDAVAQSNECHIVDDTELDCVGPGWDSRLYIIVRD